MEFPILAAEHRHDGADGFFPAIALVPHADAERVEFGGAGGFAKAHLDTAFGEDIEGGDFFGHPLRLVGGELDDAVAEADILGALAGGAEEDLGRGGVGVFF